MSHIAVMLGPDYEDSEFEEPVQALRDAGHEITIVGVEQGQSLKGKKGVSNAAVDVAAADARVDDYSAVVIPGGYSPDHLRTDPGVVDFVEQAARKNLLIAAVCHGPSLLVEADLCRGLRVTSWPSIRKDLVNAGAHWEDEPVVRDGNVITSRNPADLGPFSDAILAYLSASGERSQGFEAAP